MSGGSVAELSFVEKGGLFGELSTGLNPTLGFVLSIGLSAALLAGLLYGGLACLRHGVIRLLLWGVSGSFPGTIPVSSMMLPSVSFSARSVVATSSFTACCWSTLHRWATHRYKMMPGRKHSRGSQFPDGQKKE